MYKPSVIVVCAISVLFGFVAAYDEMLRMKVLNPPTEGCRQAKMGDALKIHYDAKLENGQMFDSSYQRKQPLEFTLGDKTVVGAWEKGLEGICAGEVRQITIPAKTEYGSRPNSDDPPMKTLVFKLELVEFGNPGGDEL